MSLPTRERGLKRVYDLSAVIARQVAPHAGAWIETAVRGDYQDIIAVAPHAGAWIETLDGEPPPANPP